MTLEVLSGPPGSGMTRQLLGAARGRSAAGKRVAWIGLPTQRASVLRQLAAEGSLIGTEFISEQQFCYRLLSRARRLRPLAVGTERLALVGAALAEVRGSVPQPGEARLFAGAIAELKRSGLDPGAAAALAFDSETQRLAETFRAYEELKADSWDYDDYRREAAELAATGSADPGADLVIVAGYRELLPVMLGLYASLSRTADVLMGLPRAPEFPDGTPFRLEELSPGARPPTKRFRARNETEEVRWVLRDVKQALAEGADPAGLAVVAPPGQFDAFLAVAGEYGVPLAPVRPETLADTRRGRTLLELIRLKDFAGPAALLALPGLERLAAAALRGHLGGRSALLELARRLDADDAERAAAGAPGDGEPEGLETRLRRWLERSEAENPGFAWAEALVETVCTEILPPTADPADTGEFRDRALRCAREARQLGRGRGFREWWAALIEETRLPPDPGGGVALLTPDVCSGTRHERAWLTGVADGAYLERPEEDYFVPEEYRQAQPEAGRLPHRFTGQEELVLREFLYLADRLTMTYAANTQDGPRHGQSELLGSEPLPPLPEQPAGAVAELESGASAPFDHAIAASRVRLPGAEVEWLAFYDRCPQRAWAEALLRRSGDLRPPPPEPWQALRRALLRSGQPDEAALRALREAHPEFSGWLDTHADLLSRLHFGLHLPRGQQLQARVDASGRIDGAVHLYRLTAPGSMNSSIEADRLLRARVAERWLAAHLLFESPRPEREVRLFAWPLGGDPIEATGDAAGRWLRRGHGPADDGYAAWLEGSVQPKPSPLNCRNCSVADMCRRSAA